MARLLRSRDRKVANLSTPSGKAPKIANTFGLPSGKTYSCPNATSICLKVCYAGRLEKLHKNVLSVLMHNWQHLQACGDDSKAIYELLAEMINDFRHECDRYKAEYKFRIHWDGDFYSPAYTQAWREVILANPDITFWVYTRVPSAVPVLTGLDNLALYFSADTENLQTALLLRDRLGVRLAYLDKTFAEGKSVLVEVGVKAVKCPENNRTIPLISAKGGACTVCSLCIRGDRDVLFSMSKK